MNLLEHFGVEFLGTILLIILGNGVVGNVVLKNTKGNNGGWLLITIGWGLAVTASAIICNCFKIKAFASFNPALTIALGISGIMETKLIAIYIIAELLGAFVGQIIVDLIFIDHIKLHLNQVEDKKVINNQLLGMHATGPAIKNWKTNLVTEIIATTILILGLILTVKSGFFDSAKWFSPIFAGMLIIVIGICLGGLTGFSLNPARDIMPRIVYWLFFRKQGSADWSYSWIPVVGPTIAGIAIGLIALTL